MLNYKEKLEKYFDIILEKEASDLHLSVSHYPIIRINGELVSLRNEDKIMSEDAKGFIFELMNENQQKIFFEKKGIDFSYAHKEKARFRVNIFFQKGEISCVFRCVSSKIRTLEELGFPEDLYRFSEVSQGLVLVTGPTSHGKSTTLTALIDRINKTRFDHVVTIEDPIEYLFTSDKSLINQREIGQDALSFADALKSTFRQDPNVIMVGEMRDPETIATTITAAETGHLVFSTLHTNSASQTIHRIIDSFPPEQQEQIRSQLSASLLGIISQRLIPGINGGRIPAYEVMTNTPAISNLILKGRIHEMNAYIETSSRDGMISLNTCLARMVKEKKVFLKDALSYSLNPKGLEKLIQ